MVAPPTHYYDVMYATMVAPPTHYYDVICDRLCQNPPLTHTMSMNSFHRQWTAP